MMEDLADKDFLKISNILAGENSAQLLQLFMLMIQIMHYIP